MLKPISIAIVTLLTFSITSPAQTKVERYDLSDLPDNNVVYALPITKLYAVVRVKEVRESPGPLALYANKYLGLKDATQEASQQYSIEEVFLGTEGIADPNQRYTIKFKNGTIAPYVYLTSDGRLCAINTDYTPQKVNTKDSIIGDSDPHDRDLSVMSEEYIQATTPAKQAEVAAREIFRTRESRVDVISGNSEQPFPDGEAMKLAINGLDRREAALTRLFTGHKSGAIKTKYVNNLPLDSVGTIVAFRFSETIGLLPADDLRGAPVYLTTEVINKAPELSPKEQEKRDKRLKGVVFCIPGKVRVSLTYKGETIASSIEEIAQWGTLDALEPALFNHNDNHLRLTFYPATGALKSISDDRQQ